MLVQLYITVGYALYKLVGHLGNNLAVATLETVGHQPLANELFRELALLFALAEQLLVGVGIEIAARIGSVNLVHQSNLAIDFTELIFGVNQNQTTLGCHLATALEQSQCVLLQFCVLLGAYDALCNDLGTRDVLVVLTDFGFGGGGYDGFLETLVLTHTVGQGHTADFACTSFVVAPRATSQVTANNHLNSIGLALATYGNHRIGASYFPVGADVGSCVEELRCDLVQHLAFVGNTLGQHHVECRDTVGSNHHHIFVIDGVNVAYFTYIQ